MLHKQFENHLLARGISSKSIRNYKSDLSHFLSWAINQLKSYGSYIENLAELVPFLSSNLILDYKSFMQDSNFPIKTINRRLSTLRSLSKFLISSQIVDTDFMDKVGNLGSTEKKSVSISHSLIADFVSHLHTQNISKNTIKNYASDVRQFLSWLESNHAHTV